MAIGPAKARERQLQSLVSQVEGAGSRVLAVEEMGQDRLAHALGSALKAFVGGRQRVDAVQLLRLETNGWPHTLVQPYSGTVVLPGEFHGVVSGCFHAPALLRAPTLRGASWESPLPDLASYLGRQGAIGHALRTMQWEWDVGMTRIRLAWGVQLRSTGMGTTHVTMHAARYPGSGLRGFVVGVPTWLAICGALVPALLPENLPAQAFLEPVQFDGLLT